LVDIDGRSRWKKADVGEAENSRYVRFLAIRPIFSDYDLNSASRNSGNFVLFLAFFLVVVDCLKGEEIDGREAHRPTQPLASCILSKTVKLNIAFYTDKYYMQAYNLNLISLSPKSLFFF
jgi:hypothetical protein